MSRKEKFGKLVLLEQSEATLLGVDYRAAKLGPTGLEKIVSVLRLRPEISAHPEAARSLMDQVKLAAQLQSPNLQKILGIGKVESSYYITHEFLEGRSLQQILERCREEHYPFAVDHALLVASKVCAALEPAHARRTEAGRMFHGLVTPMAIFVTYDGEVRLRGFGYWPSRLREAGLFLEPELRCLAPEQREGPGTAKSDIFGLGAVLFETLTGQAPPRGIDTAVLVGSAKLTNPSGEEDALPRPLSDVLQRSLAPDPAARYPDVGDMRKAIDTLLFAGDFSPTTFNLAFFMHSLFREDMEVEARALKEEREASYAEFLAEEPKPAAPAVRSETLAPSAGSEESRATAPGPGTPEPTAPALAESPPAAAAPVAHREPPSAAEALPSTLPPTASHPPHGSSPGLASKAASGFTFHREEKSRSKTPLWVGAAALLLLLGIGGGFYWWRGRAVGPSSVPEAPPPTPTTLSPEVVAAQERVKELEERLAALEAEKQAAEAKAAEDAKRQVTAKAQAAGQSVDQTAVLRAEEDARQRARQDEERRQREEMRRLEEAKKAEEARLVEERRLAEERRIAEERRQLEEAAAERRRAEEAAAVTLAPAPPPTPTPTPTPAPATPPPPTPTSAPALRAGTLVDLDDPGVIAPVVDRAPPVSYPPIALRQRVEGVVQLTALVDERGNVTDARVVSAPEIRAGLTEAAIQSVKRRKYRPATKGGVAVRVWIPVTVRFELPR
jgi:TonB family protein